jgi:uncharacterized protein (DUF58 family)
MTAPPSTPLSPEKVLQRIDWRILRRLDGLLQGNHRTLYTGVGTDFNDLREYQPDDDVRHIDWNVTARMDRPYVRQYLEDRELSAWFLIDRSPSMSFGSPGRPKELVLAELVGSLARLITRDGNRVGAILFDNTHDRTIPPRSTRNQVLLLARELLRTPAPSQATTDLSELLSTALLSIRRRSLVFVVSDFISEPGWEKPLRLLARKHEVIAIRVSDPSEKQLPDAGTVVLQDVETGAQMTVNTADPELRRRYAEAAVRRSDELTAAMSRSGIDLFEVSTDEDLVDALIRMARRRKRVVR